MLILGIVICLLVVAEIGLALSPRIVRQYEKGVLFRLGRVVGAVKSVVAIEDVVDATNLPIATARSNGGGAVAPRS